MQSNRSQWRSFAHFFSKQNGQWWLIESLLDDRNRNGAAEMQHFIFADDVIRLLPPYKPRTHSSFYSVLFHIGTNQPECNQSVDSLGDQRL